METNAIIRRLKILEEQWTLFKTTPSAYTCRWSVKQDELSMIDTFYQMSSHKDSTLSDVFIRFETPFTDAASYGSSLLDELMQIVEDEQYDSLDLTWWQPTAKQRIENVTMGFLRNLFQFAEGLEHKQGAVVAFLSPSQIANTSQWQKWWTDATALALPKDIRLMVCDTEGYETLDKIAQQTAPRMFTIRPDLKMDDAIRELMCEYADQDDNCTHFRKAFFELTQTIPKKDAPAISEASKKAFNLARLIGYPHLEVAVLCTAGTGFSTAGKLQMAIQVFDEAARIAKAAEDKPLVEEAPELTLDLPGGNIFQQLGVQVLFFKASACLAATPPQYKLAFTAYEEAETFLTKMILEKATPDEEADWTNGGTAHFHRLEAIRMMGYCSEKMGRNQQALTLYTRAIALAEKMSAEMRQSTMLPFVGQAVLNICQKKGLKKEYWMIVDKMTVLLGEDWESRLPKAA